MRFDRDTAFALQIHRIEQLVLLIAFRDRSGALQQTVGEGRLAMVNMRDDAKNCACVRWTSGKVGNILDRNGLGQHCKLEGQQQFRFTWQLGVMIAVCLIALSLADCQRPGNRALINARSIPSRDELSMNRPVQDHWKTFSRESLTRS